MYRLCPGPESRLRRSSQPPRARRYRQHPGRHESSEFETSKLEMTLHACPNRTQCHKSVSSRLVAVSPGRRRSIRQSLARYDLHREARQVAASSLPVYQAKGGQDTPEPSAIEAAEEAPHSGTDRRRRIALHSWVVDLQHRHSTLCNVQLYRQFPRQQLSRYPV